MVRLPAVRVEPDVVPLMGGMDRLGTSITVRPGSASYSFNYESVFGGGFGRVGGIERFSGQPRPSDATYVAFAAADAFTVLVGDTDEYLARRALAKAGFVLDDLRPGN